MKKLFLIFSIHLGALVFAGGFRISLQGVRQLAMAHTSAHAEDASVAFFNPAGIAFIPSKWSFVAGGFGAQTEVTYQNLNTLQTSKTDNPIGTPIYAAAAYKISNVVSVGLSFTTPFGSTVNWGNDWEGKELVQKLALQGFYFQPMVAVKMAPWVSFGASYIYALGTVDWDRGATLFNGNLNIKDKKAKGQGFGIGFYFQPNDKWDVSIAYRSPVDVKASKGVISFDTSSSLFPNIGVDAYGKDNFKATVPLVDEYTMGATYKITPRWLVSADFNYSGWSRYNQLVLDFENAQIGNQNDKTILVVPKNFKDTRTFRVGTQYLFNSMIAGRIGWYWDEAAYTTKNFIPETPSFDSHVITAGLGLNFGAFGTDVAVAKAFPKSRVFNNEAIGFSGQAKAKSFYFGLGLRYNIK